MTTFYVTCLFYFVLYIYCKILLKDHILRDITAYYEDIALLITAYYQTTYV